MTRCSYTGCSDPAEWRPVLLLRPDGYDGPPARALISIDVCTAHRSASAPAFLAETGIWSDVVRGLMLGGRVAPARERTSLEYILVTSRESRELDAHPVERPS